jgi:hypothetical protein
MGAQSSMGAAACLGANFVWAQAGDATRRSANTNFFIGSLANHVGWAHSEVKARSGKGESHQARAKQDKAGNGYCEEAPRSEFATHGTPPIVRPRTKGLLFRRIVKPNSIRDPSFRSG